MSEKAGKPQLRTVRGGKANPVDPLLELPSHSLEAEQACLGAALMSARTAARLGRVLTADDFYLAVHQSFYLAITELQERHGSVDLLTLGEYLRQRDMLEMLGGVEYINTLVDAVPTAAHFHYYARLVREHAVRRRFKEDLRAVGHDGESSIQELLGQLSVRLSELRQQLAVLDDEDAPVALNELLQRQYPPRRSLVRQMWQQGLTMLHSGPKVGKTNLLSNLVVAAATGGRFLGHFAIEERCGALCLFLEDTELDTQKRLGAYLRHTEIPDDVYIQWDWPHMGVGGLDRIDTFLSAHQSVKLVVIDTLELILAPREQGGDIYSQDVHAIRALKDLADRHQAVFVIIHHSNKSKELQDDIVASAGGTHGKTGSCDCVAQLIPQLDGTISFRGKGRRMPPFNHVYRILEDVDESCSLEYVGESEAIRDTSALNELLEALSANAMTTSELRQELGASGATFRIRIKQASELGLVRRIGQGNRSLWELTEKGRAQAQTIPD